MTTVWITSTLRCNLTRSCTSEISYVRVNGAFQSGIKSRDRLIFRLCKRVKLKIKSWTDQTKLKLRTLAYKNIRLFRRYQNQTKNQLVRKRNYDFVRRPAHLHQSPCLFQLLGTLNHLTMWLWNLSLLFSFSFSTFFLQQRATITGRNS